MVSFMMAPLLILYEFYFYSLNKYNLVNICIILVLSIHFRFNIIKNELHNIMRSQLKRVDGEVAALSQRIKALDENLAKSEEYIKTATAALADAVAMEITENQDHSEENNNPLSQFDAQMAILEGRLLQAQYLASKASSQTIVTTNNSENSEELVTVDNNIVSSSSNTPQAAEKPPPKLRRPFPVP